MNTEDHETKVRERFLKDIGGHEMRIHHADGIHRHLTFCRPDTFACGFHINTWPGYLCISGDMGSFVFSRLPDMFAFFRGDRINPEYWAEKMTADDRHSGHRTFSHDLYLKALERDFADWSFDNGEDRKRAWDEIADDRVGILHASTTEEAVRLASDWKCYISDQVFTDFWDHTLEEFSFRFLWCCYAIQWAIARYDEAAPNSPVQVAA